MKARVLALLILGGALARPALSQPGKPGEDPLARLFFPPELVLQYASDIRLQAEQRKLIVDAVKSVQGELFELQMQMVERSQELMKALGAVRTEQRAEAERAESAQRLDEAAVLAEVDKVLAVEREMKRRQMQLLIRIRNALTREQQQRLMVYRDNPGLNRPDGAPF